jgi:hypothetical protein
MKKPIPKTELAIDIVIPSSGIISFYATPDAAAEISGFGSLFHYEGTNRYSLTVDNRFIFDEVLEYIKNYG